MSMREELAVRLQGISFAIRPSREGIIQADVASALADECLRGMAWAHWGYAQAMCTAAGPETFPPITLAPDGWKP
jgi:hypothetical protein